MNEKEITPEQIAATEKAIAVIESCTTCEHFVNAVTYIELFKNQFEDKEAYDELNRLYSLKQIELNCQ